MAGYKVKFGRYFTTLAAPMKPNKINSLENEIAVLTAGRTGNLFHVEKQIERDGIEMGVLENGMPYLSESGLARMCGIARKTLSSLATSWEEEKNKPRGKYIQTQLLEAGYTEPHLYISCEIDGRPINAYTEPVCLAILEYYAFESSDAKKEAQKAYRTLARVTFREFVYKAVGYSPETKLLDSWKHWFDRVDCVENAVPEGYFCVFSEIAPIIVPMIKVGLIITDKVIPDISVGTLWSKHWEERHLDETLGKRIRYFHNYPKYYRQSLSNPQKAWAYPETALPLFRAWLRQYVSDKFPRYLLTKVKTGFITEANADLAIEALTNQVKPKTITST